MKIYFLLILYFFLFSKATGQSIKPLADQDELKTSLLLAQDIYKKKSNDSIYVLTGFKQVYKSQEVGFKNLWALYYNKQSDIHQIVIRGTIEDPLSWLANYYSPMLLGKGQVELDSNQIVDYDFASDPRAKIHAGWTIASLYLLPDIEHKLDSIYQRGTRQVILSGHSQGAAIATLITASLRQKQIKNLLPQDLQIKTYALAVPKVGDTYFSYDYLNHTNFWSYSLINAQDWVAQVPLTSQQITDINQISPFNEQNIKQSIKKIAWPKRWVAKGIVNQIEKPSKKAVKKYQKYLGNMVFGFIQKQIPTLKEPVYAFNSNYQTTGIPIILSGIGSKAYQDKFNKPDHIMTHHNPEAYLFLLETYNLP